MISTEIDSILEPGKPVDKTRLRDYLSRRSMPALAAEHFGVVAQLNHLPVPDEAVQTANLRGIMAALAEASGKGGGEVVLPAGYIFVNDTIEIGNATLPDPYSPRDGLKVIPINIRGAGRQATRLVNGHPANPLIRIFSQQAGPRLPAFPVQLREMTLLGRGRRTTGNLVELYGGAEHILSDLMLEGTAGRAIQICRAERLVIRDVITFKCRQSLVMYDACNESYLFNFQPLTSGYTEDLIARDSREAWTVNARDGEIDILKSGTVFQEKHAAVQIERTQNVRWIGGSCKVLRYLAGVKCRNTENVQIDNIYFEGYSGKSPAINPSVILGGAMELTSLIEGISVSQKKIKVEDASWFPTLYSSERIFESAVLSRNVFFAIYDPEDPTDYEVVQAYGFVGNTLHVIKRGADSEQIRLKTAPARAWPRGAVLVELAFGISDLTLHGNHLDGFQPFSSFPDLRLEKDPALGHTNGQIVVGYTLDEFFSSPNFEKDEIPGGCILELTGHNRVRFDASLPQQADFVQAHHRATVYVSPKSALGGVRVVSAWAEGSESRRWLTVTHGLTSSAPIQTTVPGGFFNLRRDLEFDRDVAADINLATFHNLFATRYGAVVDCRLYSLEGERGDARQGRSFVAAFVIDLTRGRDHGLSLQYLKASPNFTPHLRVRASDQGLGVELGLIAPANHPGPSIRLRLDATSICGQIDDVVHELKGTGSLFALSADDAITINAVSPGSLQSRIAGASGGGQMFIEDGALKYRGPNGTITTIAPA